MPEKIAACWLGKAIGGTLGMSLEGKRGPHQMQFYDPLPHAAAPNDDLDLQIVWMHHLLANGPHRLTPGSLAEAWRRHVRFPWDEYGCCLRNLHYGLEGVKVGAFDNWFAECMGAAIRSEMWACAAPGEPSRAAGFAYCDAVCDHAGDGVWAIVFLSALQSAAFADRRPEFLLDTALAFLPRASRVRHAVEDTRRWWSEAASAEDGWLVVRERILARHGTSNFTDVAANLAFTVLGWLAGEGDFGRSLCIAVNCGLDTDCTGATLGALLGILDPTGIPAAWSRPIGEAIALSKGIVDVEAPPTTSVLTEWTLRLRHQLSKDSPRVGDVLPRRPPSSSRSPIEIRMRVGWSDDERLLDAAVPGADVREALSMGGEEISLAGHWSRRSRDAFRKPVCLARREIFMERDGGLRVMAFSDTRCAAWLDGVRLREAPSGPGCQDSLAPSFHRGGRGVFDSGPLERGGRELTVAWAAPAAGASDLTLGLGDADSLLWLPFGLAGLRSTDDRGARAATLARTNKKMQKTMNTDVILCPS